MSFPSISLVYVSIYLLNICPFCIMMFLLSLSYPHRFILYNDAPSLSIPHRPRVFHLFSISLFLIGPPPFFAVVGPFMLAALSWQMVCSDLHLEGVRSIQTIGHRKNSSLNCFFNIFFLLIRDEYSCSGLQFQLPPYS